MMKADDTYDAERDFLTPPRREPPRRSLLPWFLVAAGVAVGALCIAVGVAAFLMNHRAAGVAPEPAETAVAAPAPEARRGSANPADSEALGRRLEQAVMSGDTAAIETLFDWNTMVRRAARGLDMPAGDLDSFAAGVSKGASEVATQRLVAIGEQGRFDYLRTVERDGRPRALCRLITPEGSVDFLEYVAVGEGETLRVGDAFAYSTGEDVSASLRRVLLPLVAHQNRSLLERLTGAESDQIRHGEEFAELVSTNLEGNWNRTLAIYEGLPVTLQNEKYVLLTALHAASFADDSRYLKLVDAFRAKYAKDPALDLLLVNYHVLKDEHDEAVAALRRLDEAVGGDAFVQWMIAGMLIEQEKYDAADSLLEQAIAREPDLSHLYIARVGSAVARGDHAAAVERLDEMDQAAHLFFGGGAIDSAGLREALAGFSGTETFFASPEYRRWASLR